MSIISKYYQGIYNQIQSEVEFINDLILHQGIKGEGNEAIIRELIKKFIPKKYGVSSGIVVDKNGNSSKQCDIIIFDNYQYPEIFTLSNIHIFPVDLVYAVIEVKTTLNNKQARLSIENIRSIKKLDYIKEQFRVSPTEPIDMKKRDSTLWINKVTQPPLGLVFAYQTNTSNFETITNWFKIEDLSEQSNYPSHIFCLDHGFILTHATKEPMPVLCPLIHGETYYTKDELIIITKNKKEWAEKFGVFYPVSKFRKEEILIDQSKIFLNFIMILNQLLQNKLISPRIDFRKEYLTDELKTFFTIENNKMTIYKE
jgi:hypothetical protein